MFGKAVEIFNAAAKVKVPADQQKAILNNFGPFLSEDAIVYSKKENHKGYHPKHAAIAFLQKECADHPIFTPDPVSQLTIQLYGPGTAATVQGAAKWNDDNGPESLTFIFTFVYDGSKWLYSTLWAALP